MAALRPSDDWWPAWRSDPVLEAFDLEVRADQYEAERDGILHGQWEDVRAGWQKEREA